MIFIPKRKYTIRKDGRHVAKITLAGKQYYVYGATDAEVDRKIFELKQRIASGAIDSRIMFVEWAKKWYVANKKGQVSFKTEEMYLNILNNHLIPYFLDFRLSDIREIHIKEMLAEKRDFSKSLNHKIVTTLKQIFKSAVKNQIISRNPAEDIKEGGIETREKVPLTAAQTSYLLSAVKGTRAEIFVNLALFCGLRRGEILALKWSDIDLNSRTVKVDSAVGFKNNSAYEKSTKSKAGQRIVPLPLNIIVLLDKAERTSEYVVPAATGKMMSRTAFNKMWRIVETHTDKNFYVTPHILRHTYCTSLHDAGIPLRTAQYLMGHSSIEVTAKIYTHLDGKKVVDSVQSQLDAFFSR